MEQSKAKVENKRDCELKFTNMCSPMCLRSALDAVISRLFGILYWIVGAYMGVEVAEEW